MALTHYYYPEVDSTMIRARVLADEMPPDTVGFWVRSDHQTRGRGRRDRRWEDGPGDALLTTLAIRRGGILDPGDPHAGTLALRTAAAVYGIVTACVSSETVWIKWPNDILVGDRKVCGILIEGNARWFLVGIGLNVHGAPAITGGTRSTSLGAHQGSVEADVATDLRIDPALPPTLTPTPTPERLFPPLAEAVERELRDSRWHGIVSRALAWRDHSVVIEQEGGSRQEGILRGIDEDGALLLDADAGTLLRRIYAGTVRLNRSRESSVPD